MQVHFCIHNGEPDNTNDHVLRLNSEAHPLEYANDDDANSIWVSDFMNEVNLVVDLGDQFQVILILQRQITRQFRSQASVSSDMSNELLCCKKL